MSREQASFPCPSCGGRMSVKDSRPSTFRQEKTIRRRRACLSCSHRLTTFEIIDRGQGDAELKVAAMLEAAHRAMVGLQALIDLNEAIDKPPPITRRRPPAFNRLSGEVA